MVAEFPKLQKRSQCSLNCVCARHWPRNGRSILYARPACSNVQKLHQGLRQRYVRYHLCRNTHRNESDTTPIIPSITCQSVPNIRPVQHQSNHREIALERCPVLRAKRVMHPCLVASLKGFEPNLWFDKDLVAAGATSVRIFTLGHAGCSVPKVCTEIS